MHDWLADDNDWICVYQKYSIQKKKGRIESKKGRYIKKEKQCHEYGTSETDLFFHFCETCDS